MSLPRSVCFGFEVSTAQSSGEWPGASMTFFDGLDGSWRIIEDVGIRPPEDSGAREAFAGTRRLEAEEGGGAREEGAERVFGRRGGGGGMARGAASVFALVLAVGANVRAGCEGRKRGGGIVEEADDDVVVAAVFEAGCICDCGAIGGIGLCCNFKDGGGGIDPFAKCLVAPDGSWEAGSSKVNAGTATAFLVDEMALGVVSGDCDARSTFLDSMSLDHFSSLFETNLVLSALSPGSSNSTSRSCARPRRPSEELSARATHDLGGYLYKMKHVDATTAPIPTQPIDTDVDGPFDS